MNHNDNRVCKTTIRQCEEEVGSVPTPLERGGKPSLCCGVVCRLMLRRGCLDVVLWCVVLWCVGLSCHGL